MQSVSSLVENARIAFQSEMRGQRSLFARFAIDEYRKMCFVSNYTMKWPDKALELAEGELGKRIGILNGKIENIIEAGWKPSAEQNVEAAIQRCFSAGDHAEDPISDLYALVRGAYDQVGASPDARQIATLERRLGDAQVALHKTMLHDLEMLAMKRYGDYRYLQFNIGTRMQILKLISEALISEPRGLSVPEIIKHLGAENNLQNRQVVFNTLVYWEKARAIEGIESQAIEGEQTAYHVLNLTNLGTDIVDGRQNISTVQSVQNTWNINGGVVGIAAHQIDGVVDQSVGASFESLAEALERFAFDVKGSDNPMVPAIFATAEQAAAMARSGKIDSGKIVMIMQGLASLIQTLAAVPTSWHFVVKEAARLRMNLPPFPFQ